MSTLSISRLFPFARMKFEQADMYGDRLVAKMRPDFRFRPRCSECGSDRVGIHIHRQRVARDLPIASCRNVEVSFRYRVVNCSRCNGFHVERLGISDAGGPRVTSRFARYIYDLCKLMTVQEVADHFGLDWKTVKEIDKRGLEDEFGDTDYSGLKYMAVDEISYKKRHQYLTTVLDFETGRVVWVGKGRKTETLDKFFSQMPEVVRRGIKAVAMDMWKPYRKSVQRWCPHAAIVFDAFHIISQYNAVIDEVRREEVRKVDSDKDKKAIKGTRWILLKNSGRLTETEHPRLAELLAANRNLNAVYVLKDDLKAIWQNRSREEMAVAFNSWCQRAREARLKPLSKFVKMLEAHKEGILNYADHPIHNGRLEGVNNKIKVIKRKSYGFHDLEYFCLKIKQACCGKT